MKWVKCIIEHASNLTYNKIYEVKESRYSDWSGCTYGKIINDSEKRDKKINQILGL